jgi:phospholipid-binding lipoprotein MlaA
MSFSATGPLRVAALMCLALSTAGCATTGTRSPGDPFEPANRGVFAVNRAIDRAALKPAATVYSRYTPSWFRTGVGNFFNNLAVPSTAFNQVLQGNFVAAGQDTLRFVINTTLGWGGVLDVAEGAHLPEHDEDLGQTLGKWGVPPGPFLMLPLVGPSTMRDLPSVVAQRVLEPLFWFDIGNARWGSLALSVLDTRARFLPLDPTLDRVYDKYTFVRDAFLQRRLYQIHDGNPPEEPMDPELQQAIDEADANQADTEEPTPPAP